MKVDVAFFYSNVVVNLKMNVTVFMKDPLIFLDKYQFSFIGILS